MVRIEEIEYEQERNQEEDRLNNLIEKYANSDIKGNFLVYQIYFYDPLEDMYDIIPAKATRTGHLYSKMPTRRRIPKHLRVRRRRIG